MRWFSSLASRVSPALRSQRQTKPRKPLLPPCAPHKGNHFELQTNFISAKHLNSPVIDHLYISQILSRKDWFLLLDHELNARRVVLNPQSVASVLQNQENPLHPLKFSIWVSNIDPLFLKNRSVRGVLANTLFRNGPVVLSVDLLKDVKNSGLKVTEDLLCILIGSWGRLGLANYCAEVFGQISFLGLTVSTRLYNAVIDALVKSNSLDLAYLKFQQMPADNWLIVCHPLDVVKKRFQIEGLQRHPRYGARVEHRAYSNMVDALRRIVQKEGWAGLYKGIVPSTVKAAPAGAVTFVAYEYTSDCGNVTDPLLERKEKGTLFGHTVTPLQALRLKKWLLQYPLQKEVATTVSALDGIERAKMYM